MKTTIPEPIRNHLFMYCVALGCFGGIGIIIGMVCSDKVILLLTIGIITFGFLRLKVLKGTVESGHYEEISGVILSDVRMHQKHRLVMKTIDGEDLSIVLYGRPVFPVGSEWILFISQAGSECIGMNLPQYLVPARTVLGKSRLS